MSFQKAAHLQYIEDVPLKQQITRCHASRLTPWCLCIPPFPLFSVCACVFATLVFENHCFNVSLHGRSFLPVSTNAVTWPAASHLINRCLQALASPQETNEILSQQPLMLCSYYWSHMFRLFLLTTSSSACHTSDLTLPHLLASHPTPALTPQASGAMT